jgi:hypothetical protein
VRCVSQICTKGVMPKMDQAEDISTYIKPARGRNGICKRKDTVGSGNCSNSVILTKNAIPPIGDYQPCG